MIDGLKRACLISGLIFIDFACGKPLG